ncbi:MAG: tetratricopeptide repeat protein [Bacteroidales bacterium]
MKEKIVRQIFLIFLFLIACTASFSQQSSPLSEEDREEVEKHEEMVDYYLNRDQVEDAVSSLNKIAFIYWENENTDEAIEYFLETVPLFEELGKLNSIQKIYSNIALIYTDLEELSDALEYFKKSLEVRRKIGDKKQIASGLLDVAYILRLTGDYREANKYLEEAMDIANQEEYPRMLVNIYRELYKNYDKIGDLDKYEEYRDKYSSYQEHVESQNMRDDYQKREEENLAEIRKTRAEKKAQELEAQLQRVRSRERQDSIQEVVQEKQNSLLQARRKDSLKELRIERQDRRMELQEETLERQKAQQRVQRLIIFSIAGGLLLGVFLIVVMYRSNKAKQRANKELAEKNKEIEQKSEQLQEAFDKIEDQNIKITQSISYAQGIQEALFPPKETLNNFLPESFIYFQPVDMVSGDFYWFKEIEAHVDLYEEMDEFEETKKNNPGKDKFLPFENNKFVISAVDCTGHGVPGAFMSMIGYNLLDDITQSGITRSDRILRELHKGIRKTLNQDEGSNRDGMDMSLCVINKKKRTVQFSGAKNPLLYIQDGKANLIKGDRVPIGGVQTEKERYFSETTIKVDRPTSFYIFSDGYIDQFGGPKNRKFLLKNLQNLLLENCQKPMKEQEEILRKTLSEWMGNRENQIDDILVIGFKLNGVTN